MPRDFDNMLSDLCELYKETGSNRRDFSKTQWETVKFFTTLISSLITISIASGIAYLRYLKTDSEPSIKILLLLIPVVIFVVSWIDRRNLKRECRRLFEQIGILNSVGKLLGFYRIVPKEKRFYENEDLIMPERHAVTGHCLTIKDFVEKAMKQRNTFYFVFDILFAVYMVIAVILFGCILWLVT